MNGFDSFNRTAASIKILNKVQELRNADQCVDFEGVPQYNSFSGVVYLFIDSLNIALTADEFGSPVEVQVYKHDDDDVMEMTFREYCVWKGL